MEEQTNNDLFHTFDIHIGKDDTVPIIKVDNMLLKEVGVGLVSLQIDWRTYDGEVMERFVKVEYINKKGQRVKLRQEFPLL